MTNIFDTQAWFKYAREDLDVAEILLREGFYRHAVFWVEQSSEKIIKVFIIKSHHIQDIVSKLREVNKELYRIFRHSDTVYQAVHHQEVSTFKDFEELLLWNSFAQLDS